MRCTICGHQIIGLDYPHEGMLCESCRSDKLYDEYCDQQYDLEAQRYFETQEALKHA